MWLSSIQEFADDATQRSKWLDPRNENPHFSFVEYMCCYFDNLNLAQSGYDRASAQGYVSVEEIDAVHQFHMAAEAYASPTDDYDEQTIRRLSP